MVEEAFRRNLADGTDLGASFCATVDGEVVVDLWGGYADVAGTRPWARDTIVTVFSCTKTIAVLTALLLVDRGELDVTAPVARYWPEFAANDKGDITVAQVLSHSSGLSAWTEPLAPTDVYDWEKCTTLLAAQRPLWKPGTAPGYHAATQGYLIGEVVRRITGRTIGTVFRDELAGPLGLDFHIGLPASEDDRVAGLVRPDEPPFSGELTEIQEITARNPELDPVTMSATREFRAAELPAFGGIGNARSLARALAVLVDGGPTLSEATGRLVLEEQIQGLDLVLGLPVRYGLGLALGGGFLPNPNTALWGGNGGSLVVVDFDARASYAYAMNKMSGAVADLRGLLLATEAMDAVRAGGG